MELFTVLKAGKFQSVNGQIEVTLGDIEYRAKAGDFIPEGASVIVFDGALFTIKFENGEVHSNSENFTSSNASKNLLSVTDANDIENIQAIILAGGDPTLAIETAAGGTQQEGGFDFIAIDRTGDETIAQAGFNTLGLAGGNPNGNTQEESIVLFNSVLANDSNTIAEDQVAVGNVLANDVDPDSNLLVSNILINGQSFAAGQNIQLENGGLVVNANGDYRFEPDANWHGTLPLITYTTNTGVSATLTIVVTPVNDDVNAEPDSFSVAEDGSVILNLLPNDTAPDGGLAIQSINGVALTGTAQAIAVTNGQVFIAANGTITFEPTANYNGEVTFSYVAQDADGDTDEANVSITVEPQNDLIDAIDDSFNVDEDGSVTLDLLANDTAPDGGKSIVSINGVTLTGSAQAIAVTNGNVLIAADGTITFEPTANYNGEVTFSYVAQDADGDTDEANVSITVEPLNDLIDAVDDNYNVPEDGSVTLDLLANDIAPDGGKSIVSINGITLTGSAQTIGVTNGQVLIAADGTITFEPVGDYNGEVSFNYIARDVDGDTDEANVSITVEPQNDLIDAIDDSFNVDEDGSVTLDLLANDTAPDGGKSIVSINGITLTGSAQTIAVTNGNVLIAADGTITFEPVGDYNGEVSFNYIARDVDGDTDEATVTIAVTPENDSVNIATTGVYVSEEGLVGGVPDNDGVIDTTDSATGSGAIVLTNVDGDNLTLELGGPAGLNSGGEAVNWHWDDGSQTLIGYTGTDPDMNQVMTIKLNAPVNTTGGTWTYDVTLLQPVDHADPLTEDAISPLFSVIVTDSENNVDTGSFFVAFEDDGVTANSYTHVFDISVESFISSNIEANWANLYSDPSDPNFNSTVNRFDGNDNDLGLDQIRWGTTSGSQSGYGFVDNDINLGNTLPLNQDIVLGTFTHYNFSIGSGTSISEALLNIAFSLTDSNGVETSVDMNIEFDHNETPNNSDSPEDIITVGDSTVTFEYEGSLYSIQVIGFVDASGNVKQTIETEENTATSHDLVIRIVEGDQFTPPSLNGNIIETSVAGADQGFEVIGIEFGDTVIAVNGGTVTIAGQFGELEIDDEGNYTYTLNVSADLIPDNQSESFTYIVKDADGDTDEANLVIDLNVINQTSNNITSSVSGLSEPLTSSDIFDSLINHDSLFGNGYTELSSVESNKINSQFNLEHQSIMLEENLELLELKDNENGLSHSFSMNSYESAESEAYQNTVVEALNQYRDDHDIRGELLS
ncbi:retention module-containing protein [Parashewanella curva]|uniref:Retention module-containing protein n=1 Tax=Parashewanella curva TaxID=2338552 RepID=A0A3L8PYK0_9GAMM|nr:retention module-containing protein [Parashewanella curva]RLV60421.1 retention module-containing protein [Parashewanella curva]